MVGMRRRQSVIILILTLASLLLAACQPATPSEADCTQPYFVCVGLVTSLKGINDRASNQAAWQGVLQAKTDNLVDWVRYIETVDTKDYEANISLLVNAGYDIIVTVGELFTPFTISAAQASPGIHFIGVDQQHEQIFPNLADLAFNDDQLGFLAGALAAQMTNTGTIAAVLGTQDDPQAYAFEQGYGAGAHYINANTKIIAIYYPGDGEVKLTQPRWGANVADQVIQSGADVVFGAGGKIGDGALIKTATYPGLFCIGAGSDQWENIPEAHPCLLASAVRLISTGVYDLLKPARSGSIPSGTYYGAVAISPYHDFEDIIPKTVQDRIGQIEAGLRDGAITTGIP